MRRTNRRGTNTKAMGPLSPANTTVGEFGWGGQWGCQWGTGRVRKIEPLKRVSQRIRGSPPLQKDVGRSTRGVEGSKTTQ